LKDAPVELIRHQALDRDHDGILLVMLPGAGIEAKDFAEHGFVRDVQERGGPVDVVAARPELDLYLDGTIAEAIERRAVAPARSSGRARIWHLGISLGGMGALLHARAYPGSVEGVVLLAPFLGTPGILAEVASAGGLEAWRPGAVAANDSERQLLVWLKDHLAAPPPQPVLYLGYGRGDRFAKGHAMLGERLPPERVVVTEGGHDWPTWRDLWRQILERRPFTRGGEDC
jgi:pimeloyl-ACP methyl ester carboxylesterase